MAEVRAEVITEVIALRRRLADLEGSLSDDERAGALLHPESDTPRVEAAHDAVVIIDAHQNIVRFDANAERLFGYSAETVTGRNLGVLLPPEVADIHARHVAAFAASPDVARAMGRAGRLLRGLRADGTTIPIEVSIVKVRGAPNAGIKAAFIREAQARKQDGSAIRRAERALRVLSLASEAMEAGADERAIFQRMCDALVTGGHYLTAWVGIPEHDERRTVRAAASTGIDSAILDLVVWSDAPAGRGPTGTALRTGRPAFIQSAATEAAGDLVRAVAAQMGVGACASFPLFVERRVIGALTVSARESDAFDTHEAMLLQRLASDLSRTCAMLRARTERQEAEARLGELLDTAGVMAWSRAPNGEIQLFGSAVERVLGYRAETLAQDRALADRVLLPDDREAAIALGRDAARTGRAQGRLRFVRSDGEVRWLDITARAVRGPTGEPVGFEGYGIDATDRLLAAQTIELQRANEALGATSRAKDEFLAAVSHELRTPLNAVLGLSEALQEDVYGRLTEKQNEAVSRIAASGRRQLGLVDDILNLAELEAGNLVLDTGPVSVAELCHACLDEVDAEALAQHIRLTFTTASPDATLTGDASRLRQAIVHLLRNAVKFTPDGGGAGIEATFDIPRNAWRIAVWDTGIGIRGPDRARLFQPFTQLDGKLSRTHGGMGLGLVLARRLVKLHGGEIEVQSNVGGGSRFVIVLPVPSP